MRFFTLPALLAAALFSAVVVQPWLPSSRQHTSFALEARVTSTRAGHVQAYPDIGEGFLERTSVRQPVPANIPVVLRFPLPAGNYRALRLDPLDTEGTITLDHVRFVRAGGHTVREVVPGEFVAANQIEALQVAGEQLVVKTTRGSTDSQLVIKFEPPLAMNFTRGERLEDFLSHALAVLAGIAALLYVLDRQAPAAREKFAGLFARIGARPGRALALVALIAVVASAYPVVFLGKSYVSPDFGTLLLYEDFPTLPGYQSEGVVDLRGSDVGTAAWQDLPAAVVQRAALAGGELPLWNRYNSCGTALLGQGQSMFGDPLHFIPVLANSAAWAWDLKYLCAKWLFAVGLGVCVLSLTAHLPAALLTAAAAPFVGFFVYRVNHPAFFSVCYAPWVLATWLNFVASPSWRKAAGWLVGLMLANWALLNSGTVKEAYMLLLGLNLAGAAVLLSAARPWRERLGRLAAAAWAGGLFTLLTLPVLLTFADTLAGAYTSYNAPSAYQIQPGLLLGFFDEAFYRPLSEGEMLFNPAMNLLLLGGVLYFLATLRENLALRAAMAVGATALLPLALAFGFVPARWIVRVPFLANIAHVDNTFSCVLIVLAAVLAGVGFRRAFERLGTPAGRADLVLAGLLLFALVFGYVSFTQAVHRSVFGYGTTFTFMKPGDALPVTPFVWTYLWVGLAALVVGALALRRALVARAFSPATALILLTCALVLVWRNGLQANSGFEAYVARPGARVDLHARSEAVEFMRAAVAAEPARGVGLRDNLFPGWTGYYRLESNGGPDALMNPRYRELMEGSGLTRRWDWNYLLTNETAAAARPLFDLCNVRFYFDYRSDPAQAPAGLRLARAADLEVYESPTAWPRAFFTDRLATYEGAAEFLRQVRGGDGRPFAAAQTGDLAGNSSLAALPRGLAGRAIAPAAQYRLTENTTSFTVQASGPGLAVLTEVFWPGDFRAELDGKEVPIASVNHAFKGVLIERAGEHKVSFRYQPRRFTRAGFAALAGAMLLAGSLGLVWRRTSVPPP